MKLTLKSTRDSDFISFEPLTDISSNTCDVEARLGTYSVHDDLPLLEVSLFCPALRAFVEGAADQAVLEGTYDFRFTLRPYRGSAVVWAEFYLAKFILQDDGNYGRLALGGGFCVSRAAVVAFSDSFLQHFAHSQANENA